VPPTAVIFGAGRTGRGFAAHLAARSGYAVVLVDVNAQLVDHLQREGRYAIQVLGSDARSAEVPVSAAFHLDDEGWGEALAAAPVAFTAVFGNNLPALGAPLAAALRKRREVNPARPLTIITCENLARAAGVLEEAVAEYLDGEEKAWLAAQVGFSEGIVFKTCLGPGPGQSPLTVRAQDYFELPCDGAAFKEPVPMAGLKPLPHFGQQLVRKLYTYNGINAVIAYLGARKGYEQLWEAAQDAEIRSVAWKAATEISAALVAEYGFDLVEQEAWTEAALAKFGDRHIPDPVHRNAADPVRKLSRTDRLVGPALLALKHGLRPEGLLAGIVAGFGYADPVTGARLTEKIEAEGIGPVLHQVCGLRPEEPLFTMIRDTYLQTAHGR
jgi:mannitol-1-phosphate 5-dehydrogenase